MANPIVNAEDHVANRRQVVEALRLELVGPAPVGDPIDCVGDIHFEDVADAYRPRHEAGTGEEILQRDSPTRRYGIGVLFPLGADEEEDDARPEATGDTADVHAQLLADSAAQDLETLRRREVERQTEGLDDEDLAELDLTGTNAYKPTSMAISFLLNVRTAEGAALHIDVRAARYRKKPVHIGPRNTVWWVRQPLNFDAVVPFDELIGDGVRRTLKHAEGPAFSGLDIRIEVFSRPHSPDSRLVTVCLVNRTPAARPVDELTLFQTGIAVRSSDPTSRSFLPYPSSPPELLDDEEQSLDLLYRNVQTFAVGHGCAADWSGGNDDEHAAELLAISLPTFETPSITPDIEDPDSREPLVVSMRALSGLERGHNGLADLERVVRLYEQWISDRETEAAGLPIRYRRAAQRHTEACRDAALRMRDGLAYLESDLRARRAFELANYAILIQQVNAGRSLRTVSLDPVTELLVIEPAYAAPNVENLSLNQGRWRPFQVAFLLLSLRSAASGPSRMRRTVELIWFPTGGGKTEAHLALSAFTIFMRRMTNADDIGTSVLMRYTLRLLTAQQFQRACRLVCAMEWLRQRDPASLGRHPLTIGIWLGGDTTPNTRQIALSMLRKLQQDPREDNRFLVDQCPWCRAPLGVVMPRVRQPARRTAVRGRSRNAGHLIVGYEQRGNTVSFFCPDPACPFHALLPILVIDEDIYTCPPAILIGTVDKFAVLAWKDSARSIFGLGADGARDASPPRNLSTSLRHRVGRDY